MHFCFKLHVIVVFALYFFYVFIIPAVMSEIQSFMILLIQHYVFDMFALFVYCWHCICCVYDNVTVFDLFQHVSKCIWNNFIDVIKFLFF